jgi:hypothetical protein
MLCLMLNWKAGNGRPAPLAPLAGLRTDLGATRHKKRALDGLRGIILPAPAEVQDAGTFPPMPVRIVVAAAPWLSMSARACGKSLRLRGSMSYIQLSWLKNFQMTFACYRLPREKEQWR